MNSKEECLKRNLPVVHLEGGRFAPGTIELIEFAEGSLSPDAETTNVTTRSEFQEIQFSHTL